MAIHTPAHPGEMLRHDVLDELDLSIKDAAGHLGVSRNSLSKICNGNRGISAEMAVRLEMVFRKPNAEMWLQLQANYDLWEVRQHNAALDVKPINHS